MSRQEPANRTPWMRFEAWFTKKRHALVVTLGTVASVVLLALNWATNTYTAVSAPRAQENAARIGANGQIVAAMISREGGLSKGSGGVAARGEGHFVGVPRALPAGASAAGADALAQACATVPASVEEGETWTIDIEGERLGGRDIQEGQTEYFIYSTQCDAVWTTRF
jgi:hypothetical protein